MNVSARIRNGRRRFTQRITGRATAMLRVLSQIGLGLFLVTAGISHLTVNRLEFQAQVPSWLPLDPDIVVLSSGIVEIALGAALLTLWSHRGRVGLVVALFFVAIFPGNISQYVNGIDAFGLNTDSARALRLLGQPLLIAWALWSTGTLHQWQRARGSGGRYPPASR